MLRLWCLVLTIAGACPAATLTVTAGSLRFGGFAMFHYWNADLRAESLQFHGGGADALSTGGLEQESCLVEYACLEGIWISFDTRLGMDYDVLRPQRNLIYQGLTLEGTGNFVIRVPPVLLTASQLTYELPFTMRGAIREAPTGMPWTCSLCETLEVEGSGIGVFQLEQRPFWIGSGQSVSSFTLREANLVFVPEPGSLGLVLSALVLLAALLFRTR